ncbi:hypothetical protein DSECCO2_594990 [anaerobic digester metagenome]
MHPDGEPGEPCLDEPPQFLEIEGIEVENVCHRKRPRIVHFPADPRQRFVHHLPVALQREHVECGSIRVAAGRAYAGNGDLAAGFERVADDAEVPCGEEQPVGKTCPAHVVRGTPAAGLHRGGLVTDAEGGKDRLLREVRAGVVEGAAGVEVKDPVGTGERPPLRGVSGGREGRRVDRMEQQPPDLVDRPAVHRIRVSDGLYDELPEAAPAGVKRKKRLGWKAPPVEEHPSKDRLQAFCLVDGVDDPADADGARADGLAGVALDAVGKIEPGASARLEGRGHLSCKVARVSVRSGIVDPCRAVRRAGTACVAEPEVPEPRVFFVEQVAYGPVRDRVPDHLPIRFGDGPTEHGRSLRTPLLYAYLNGRSFLPQESEHSLDYIVCGIDPFLPPPMTSPIPLAMTT